MEAGEPLEPEGVGDIKPAFVETDLSDASIDEEKPA
jgi:hypothetical protein